LIELNLAGDFKGNKKSFYRYIGDKTKTMGKCGPSLEGNRRPGYLGYEKAEVLNDIFTSFFTSKSSSHTALLTDGKSRDWENEEPLNVEDQI